MTAASPATGVRAPFDSVLALLADGARADVMAKMAAAGELPTLKRHFFDAGGWKAATSVFPSVSGPAHLPVLTGAHPGRVNLPGIRWAERPGRYGFWRRTRSYMAPFRSYKLQRDVPAQITTLFQHVPHLADVNTWFVRGCPARARRTRFSKAASFFRSWVSKDWYAGDVQAERATVGALAAGYSSVFAVFPAIDEMGHRFGPLSEQSYEAYRRFDKALGRVMEALHRQGRADRTLVMVTSDHGQSETHTHFELDDFVAQTFPRTLSYPKLWRNAFRTEAAVMVSGNAMANIYIRGASGWGEPPDFHDPAGRPAELLDRLLGQEAVDHVIYRQGDSYVVAGRKGRTRITPGERDAHGTPVSLAVDVTGEDPLGNPALPARVGREATAGRGDEAAYPDALWQVVDFYRSPRAGDLVVCASSGFDLRNHFEYQPHRGSHGGLHWEHMRVPALINARWDVEALRSVDLFPSILQALGVPVPAADQIDGRAAAIHRA